MNDRSAGSYNGDDRNRRDGNRPESNRPDRGRSSDENRGAPRGGEGPKRPYREGGSAGGAARGGSTGGGYRGGSSSGGSGSSGGYRGGDRDRAPQRDNRGGPGERRDSRDDRPKRDFNGDRPQRSFDGPKRDFNNDRPQRSFDSDRPRRDNDRPQRSFDDRPKHDFNGDRPQRSFDGPKREYNADRPQRSFDGPKRDFNNDRPKRSFDDRPKRDFGSDRPQRSFDDRPKRDFNGDRPQRSFDDRPKRDFNGDRPQRSFDDRPKRDFNSDRPQRSFDRDRPQRDGGFGRDNARGGNDSFGRGGTRGGGRSDRGGVDREWTEAERLQHELRPVRSEHWDPSIPEEVVAKDLHPGARNELKTLEKDLADVVARHLAMVGILIDTDPELAHQHAISASRKAGRIPVTRETLAITSYVNGDFATALRELRTYRRLSGSEQQLAMMIDCERALGRPEKAIEVGHGVEVKTLSTDVQVQVAIAMSGARLDLGQTQQALFELEIPQLDPLRAFSWSPELFAAYSAVLSDLGREREAAQWQKRAEVAEAALEEQFGGAELEVFEVVEEYSYDYDRAGVELNDTKSYVADDIADGVAEESNDDVADDMTAESSADVADEVAEVSAPAEAVESAEQDPVEVAEPAAEVAEEPAAEAEADAAAAEAAPELADEAAQAEPSEQA